MKWITLRTLPLALALALLPYGWVGAEEDPAQPEKIREVLDLSDYLGLPVVDGPLLLAPCDRPTDSGVPSSWSVGEWTEPGTRRTPWVLFDVGENENVVAPETLVHLLGRLDLRAAEELNLNALPGGNLRARGTQAALDALRARLAWALAVIAPSAELAATLTGGDDGALLAAGRARLFPGRWTQLWFQEQRTPYPVDCDIEIAQEVTASHPVLASLSEGQELYVRWLPGETCSVLEVWSGDLEHLDEVLVDLSPVRNVPESSGPTPVRIPRTALRRGYTAVRLDGTSGASLAWRSPEGVRRLRLDLRALPPPSEPLEGGGIAHGVLRVGAQSAGLLFQARPSTGEWLMEELNAAGSPDTERSLEQLSESMGTLLIGTAAPGAFAALRAEVRKGEAALATGTLRVRTLTVPEEVLRPLLASGGLTLGEPLATAARDALQRAGPVEGLGVELPLLAGAKAGFRVGRSVPGLVRIDVEVAQMAGGVDAVFGARFAGLAGEALLTAGPQGSQLRLDATLSWADSTGGKVDLTLRPPVGMQFSKERPQNELEGFRRVTLPTLAGASTDLFATLPVTPGEATERLVGVSVRDGECVLLLASVEMARR